MNIKLFFKPTLGKIIVSFLLFYPAFMGILFLTSGMNIDCAVG